MAQVKKRKFSKPIKQESRGAPAPKDPTHRTSFNIYLPSDKVLKVGILLSVLGIIIFSVGTYYVQTIHDNERYFSDLSDVERELSFRSEMGFYYYFYKSFISAKSARAGIRKFIHEPFIEYPDVVNTMQRFTVWPEFLIGLLYKLLNYYDLLSYECFSFKRDDGYTYESCVGLGEPIFFYLQFAWYSAGFTTLFVFCLGFYLSKSAFGGFLSLLSYYYNHAECSRVQWAPSLRETFAYPVILLEIIIVSITIDKNSEMNYFQPALHFIDDEEHCCCQGVKSKKPCEEPIFGIILHIMILSCTTAFALMFWQFSQFVLFTQFGIISFLYVCNQLSEEFMFLFTFCQWWGIFIACMFLQFNDMLVSSLFNCWTMATFMMFLTFKFVVKVPSFLKKVFSISMVPSVTFVLRHTIFTEDDSHIFSLLKAKLTNFENFHTLIYTCSAEYNFLPLSILINLCYTGLLPLVIFILASVFYYWTKTVKKDRFFGDIDVPVLYNLMQFGVFCVMAAFFMRLKLFSNTHLCILASLFTSKYMPNIIRRWNIIWVLILVLCMSYQGIQNMKAERTNTGTFTYPPLEDLLIYIKNNTLPESVYAGPMTTTAAILLTMQRPVVLHPHYEHVKIRNRTKDVYTIFSRKSESEIYEKLKALHANYVIIDYMWCFSTSKMGCLLTETWDKEDVKNRKNPSFCSKVYDNSTGLVNFEEVYQNDAFSLLKLKNSTVCAEAGEISSHNQTKSDIKKDELITV